MAANLLEGSWRLKRWQGPFSEMKPGPTGKKKTLDTKQQHDMIQPEEGGKKKTGRPLALRKHAPSPHSVAHQSFCEEIAEDLAQTLRNLHVVRIP